MNTVRIEINEAALKDLQHDPRVLAAIETSIVPAVVAEMKRRAPKATGAGAESISYEPDPDQPGFRVTWDKDHFYMAFHELGTEHQSARPFARPTADDFNRKG